MQLYFFYLHPFILLKWLNYSIQAHHPKAFFLTAGWRWNCSVSACCWFCCVPVGPEDKSISDLPPTATSASSLAQSMLGAQPLTPQSAVTPRGDCGPIAHAVLKVTCMTLRVGCRLSRMAAGKYPGLKIHCETLYTWKFHQIKDICSRTQWLLKYWSSCLRLLNFCSTEPVDAKSLFLQPQELSLRLRPGVSQSFPLTITMPTDQPISELTLDTSPVPAGVNVTFSNILNGNPLVVEVGKNETDILCWTLGNTS